MIADLRGFSDDTPPRMRRRPTQDIRGLVDELLVKHQIGRPSVEQGIRDRWPELVGAANAAYSHATQLDPRGKLAVLVTHPVVRNELFLHREMILERIRALPGCGGVKGLQFRNG
jgi:hypothetical protein